MREVDRGKLDCEGYPTESRQEMKKESGWGLIEKHQQKWESIGEYKINSVGPGDKIQNCVKMAHQT